MGQVRVSRGTGVDQVWVRCREGVGQVLLRCGSGVEKVWVRCCSGVGQCWVRFRVWSIVGQVWVRCVSGVGQVWHQAWVRCGSGVGKHGRSHTVKDQATVFMCRSAYGSVESRNEGRRSEWTRDENPFGTKGTLNNQDRYRARLNSTVCRDAVFLRLAPDECSQSGRPLPHDRLRTLWRPSPYMRTARKSPDTPGEADIAAGASLCTCSSVACTAASLQCAQARRLV